MRRKSSRSTTKSAAHEGQRKSRRQSRRHKKSSSRSSSEDSEEKPIEQVPAEKVDEASALNIEIEPEQPVWKVTPSSTPSGEIQKLKFCLTRPLMSPDKDKPDRRRRNKSGDRTDEEITSPSEKMPRKSRHRGSSGDNEHEEERDSQENRKGKGKSKTKHKSKCEKTPQIQDIEDNSQSDIITNVQVTPQSPQASIDTRVDTEYLSTIESETVTDETEEHVAYQNENSMDDCGITSRSIEIVKGKKSYRENESSTPPPILEKHENFQTNVSDFEEFCRNIEAPVLTMAEHFEQSVKEEIVKIETNDVKKEIKVEHSLKAEGGEEMDIEPPPLEVTIPETLHAIQETIHILRTVIETAEEGLRKENMKIEDEPVEEIQIVANDSDSSLEAPEPANCENVTSPVDNDGSEVINENLNETMEVDKINSDEESISRDTTMDASTTLMIDNSFEMTQSFSPDIKQIQEVNEEIQNMKEQTIKLLQTSTPLTRKWGKSSVGLELMKPVLHKIDINTIKEFCPTLQFLDESEIKIDVRERKSSYSHEQREKRKISIDYKSDDGDYKRIEKQNSVNSLEMEEIAESENDNSNIIAMNRKISIVDDTASKLKPPPSPAKNPTSEILFITNLVRPFTLKQLKELLERTGKIRENGFWTDRIKSKCYAYYESVDQAEVTRNALHGVNWPIGNGKKLIIEYATEEDLDKAKNPTPPPAAPQPLPPVPEEIKTTKDSINEVSTKNNKMEEPSKVSKERQRHRSEGHIREWDIGKENVHKTRHRNKEFDSHENKNDRHKRRRTPTPSDDFISRKAQKKEEELPQKLMDDLFRKTKTTPSIYWLPLTPEEIATKQQQRLLRMAEHKRRMEESSRGRGDYGRGAPYRRRYD
ncbi:hypothetical protein FQA39_LY11310 [Lamprigera yunnana]|nr:hypothetical protein FQA39_LY11310 [Lamprigera yunnana]